MQRRRGCHPINVLVDANKLMPRSIIVTYPKKNVVEELSMSRLSLSGYFRAYALVRAAASESRSDQIDLVDRQLQLIAHVPISAIYIARS